ncbi:hypothetical protein T492DRAFT_360902 [Pavlovales sp. CCMP2436]|nr:hypothetical protein T492DRAFT_360902 [Pavlovales sp. CCMP2436]
MAAASQPLPDYDEFVRRRLVELQAREAPPRSAVDAPALLVQMARVQEALAQRRRAAVAVERELVRVAVTRPTPVPRRAADPQPRHPACAAAPSAPPAAALPVAAALPPPVAHIAGRAPIGAVASPPARPTGGHPGSWPMPPSVGAVPPRPADELPAQTLGTPASRLVQPMPAPPVLPQVCATVARPLASSAHTRAAARLQGLARGRHVRAALRSRKGTSMAQQVRDVVQLFDDLSGKTDDADRQLAGGLRQQLHRQQAELSAFVDRPLLCANSGLQRPTSRPAALMRTPRPTAHGAGLTLPPFPDDGGQPACSMAAAASQAAAATPTRRPLTATARGRGGAAHAAAARGICASAESASGVPSNGAPGAPTPTAGSGGLSRVPASLRPVLASAAAAAAAEEAGSALAGRQELRREGGGGGGRGGGGGGLGGGGGFGGFEVSGGVDGGGECGYDGEARDAGGQLPATRHQFLKRRSANPPVITATQSDWSHVPARTKCRLASAAASAVSAPNPGPVANTSVTASAHTAQGGIQRPHTAAPPQPRPHGRRVDSQPRTVSA